MAAKLKDFFDAAIVRAIARSLRDASPGFRERAFVTACLAGLEELELTARASHVADQMHAHLPQPFAVAADAIVDSLGPELDRTEDFGMAPFRYLPHVTFVAKYGLGDFEAAMRAQYELTKRFTAEFSIRAFIEKYPEATYERLRAWASDPSVHVRRLVSEGTRPRLPWAPRLPAYQRDPQPVLALLELLADDPERYVQRSVANNLNDIAKDHPEVAVDVCRRWQSKPARQWIVKHALRSLVKAGHPGALETLGVGAAPRVEIEEPRLVPGRVKIGGSLRLSFELASTAETPQELLVDYAVHFVKASGATNRKVFKLRRLALPAAAREHLETTISFAQMTTRRHYPGKHRIEVLVNGTALPLGEVVVVA